MNENVRPISLATIYDAVGVAISTKSVDPEELIHALENCIATAMSMSTATADECCDAAHIIAKNIERKYLHLVRMIEDASTPETTDTSEAIATETNEQPVC
jgi:transcription initiation factor TFIIIB Brf1 subunit/transcription initiation factor TFIIB